VKNVYFAYFSIKLEDQDKNLAPQYKRKTWKVFVVSVCNKIILFLTNQSSLQGMRTFKNISLSGEKIEVDIRIQHMD